MGKDKDDKKKKKKDKKKDKHSSDDEEDPKKSKKKKSKKDKLDASDSEDDEVEETHSDEDSNKKSKKKKKKKDKKHKGDASDSEDSEDSDDKKKAKKKKKKKDKKNNGDASDSEDSYDSDDDKKAKKKKKKKKKDKKHRGDVSDSEGSEGSDDDKRKKKKKKKKDKKHRGDASDSEDSDDDKKGKKKKKKSKKDRGDASDSEEESLKNPELPKKDKKKKKSKKDNGDASGSEGSLQDFMGLGDVSPKRKKKDKKKNKDREDDEFEDSLDDLVSTPKPNKPKISNLDASFSALVSPGKVKKYTPEYLAELLGEVRGRCEKKISLKSGDVNKFLETCDKYYNTWWSKVENEQWLHDLLENKGSQEEIDEAQAYVDESNKSLPKYKAKSTKAALKIFESLDQGKMESLEDRLVKAAIISQATPEGLAEFAQESSENEKLIKKLFNDAELMKDMLRHGGAAKYMYGKAMKIYTECLKLSNNPDHRWERVNKKIALACALELAAPMFEFDSSVQIDPIARFKHFHDAFRNGELDPAFPHFSVWEMRQIVNCDAPNEQLTWGRQMVMNYVPYITCITDITLRYVYILESDVRIRSPTWTASPRTYPMILSGGGNESINSWFGRFILKSFGLPAWGTKERRKEGYTRWTPEGWVALNGAKWETCTWQGKTGTDMKMEIEARNKAPPQEYWEKLVMLQCLADVVDGNPGEIPDEEKDVLHPERFWRSMSIISMALLFETEPEVERTYERKGRSLVETKCEKYLKKYEADLPDDPILVSEGMVQIPPCHHGFQDGHLMIIDSYEGPKQLNFIAGGDIEYEIPDDAPAKTYSLYIEVCTVSAKQNPLLLTVSGGTKIKVKIPYTNGEWKTTDAVAVEAKGSDVLRFSRAKGSMGLAIKNFTLS